MRIQYISGIIKLANSNFAFLSLTNENEKS